MKKIINKILLKIMNKFNIPKLEISDKEMLENLEKYCCIGEQGEEFIEQEIELYTVELTEENKNILGYTAPIRAVYKEIYNVLQKLKEQ